MNWPPPLDGDLIRWAATGLFTAVGWLIGRHDRLRAADRKDKEQRKQEQAEARRAAKTLADAIATKNAEIDYLRTQNERLLGEIVRSSSREPGAHG